MNYNNPNYPAGNPGYGPSESQPALYQSQQPVQYQQGGYPPQVQSGYPGATAPATYPSQGYAPPHGYPGVSSGMPNPPQSSSQGYNQPQGYPAPSEMTNPPQGGQLSEKAPWNPSQATSYSGPDLATEDVLETQDNTNATSAAAPPPSYDLVVSGYENVGGASDNPVGPPPPYESTSEMVPALVDTSRLPTITDEEAREALMNLVEKSACWGSGAARNMVIKDMTPSNAYHYTLETYTEGRTTKYTHVPFKGGYVDGPGNGAAPLPWDIPCSPTVLFKTETHKIPVPHTEVVKPCHLCWGRGFNRCSRCHGRGNTRCGFCHGSGHRHTTNAEGHSHHTTCSSCNGRGRRRCHTCHGSGCVICFVCSGYGSIKQFIQLTVLFTNHLSDHILERTDLPNELIRNVQGDVLFQQTYHRVCPVENFYEREINQKSMELINTHGAAWPAERVLQQRHTLRTVPVQECHFEFQRKPGRFWVYGHQREVYTTDYPHTCCCCRCTIL